MDAITYSYLRDKKNNKYTVSLLRDGDGFDAHISWKNNSVGLIRWYIDDANQLVLGDIIIFDPPLISYKRILCFIPVWYRRKSFRGLGLGSAMLEFVIAQAKNLEVDGIWGIIVPDDPKTPNLAIWYQRHGFEVDGNQIYRSM